MRGDCVGAEFVQRDTDNHHPQRSMAEGRHQRGHSDQDHRDLRCFEEGIVGEKTSSPTMLQRKDSKEREREREPPEKAALFDQPCMADAITLASRVALPL